MSRSSALRGLRWDTPLIKIGRTPPTALPAFGPDSPMDIFKIAAGISTAFGLIAFVAALYFRSLATRKELSIRGVIGDEIAYL